MDKAIFAPIHYVKCEPKLNKMNKEELEDAGVIIDYLNEDEELIEEMKNKNPRKRWKLKKSQRWILLMILVFFVITIVKLGMVHIEYEKGMEQIHATLENSNYMNESLD